MKLIFIMINYNNSLITEKSVKSIWNILGLTSPDIIIIDNASNTEEVKILESFQINNQNKNLHIVFEKTNKGYFPGLNIGIEYVLKHQINFDAIIIGNNDLFYPNDFNERFNNNYSRFSVYPVVSPNLITLDGIHQNPHVLKKITTLRGFLYKIYFINYYISVSLFYVSLLLGKLSKRKDNMNHEKSQVINQGYGACYILTKVFFKYFKSLDAPVFLMGEEYFLSHQIHSVGLELFYDAELVIYHQDHASIKSPYSRKMWEITKKSYLIYKKFL